MLEDRMRVLLERRKSFDSSSLGITKSDLDAMSPEEEQQELIDAINRAADLCQSIVSAFPSLPSGDAKVVSGAAKALIKVARSL